MNNKYDTKLFIEKAKKVHSDKYDYSNVEYKGCFVPIKIICKNHGTFEQKPTYHLKGSGCKICAGHNIYTENEFIKKCEKVHNNKYYYNDIKYISTYKDIDIVCPIHGKFTQKAGVHLNGGNCPKCSKSNMIKKLSNDTPTFINKAKEVHGERYEYTKVDYRGSFKKIDIICKNHGVFKQSPSSHLQGRGCPKCKNSKLENQVTKLLNNLNIKFIPQKSFVGCKNKKLLKFDFYLPKYNICVECDGEQHYRIREFNGGEEGFKNTKLRDKIKEVYCENNNIPLLRISYKDNIKEKLLSFLSNHINITVINPI